MSFAKYLARDILFFLFAAITLPLWLPFWLWTTFRYWLDNSRFWWEVEQAAERQRKLRAEFDAREKERLSAAPSGDNTQDSSNAE